MTRKQMTFLTTLLAIITFTFVGCRHNKGQTFESFISRLDNIDLPYSYDSSIPLRQTKSFNGLDNLFFEDGPTLHDYIGYFKGDSNNIHILTVHSGDFFEDLCISTFDNEGNLLNRVSPSFDDCVGQVPLDNNFKSCKETISINQDKKIICTYFKTVLNINKKDSLIMDTKTFHLTTAGRLEKE
jgi:hypothetical protein